MARSTQSHEAFLALVFRSAVGSVLAGSVYSAATTGRAQSMQTRAADASKLDESPIGQSPCDEDRPVNVQVLRPQVKLDYLSSRSNGRIWNAVGLPCRGATDRTTCDAAVLKADETRAAQGPFLLGTRGDSVLTWAGPDELLSLVGQINDVPTATEYLRSKRIERLMCPIQQIADGFLFETRETKEVKGYDTYHDLVSGIRCRMHLSRVGALTLHWTRPFQEIVPNGIVEGRRPPGLQSFGPRVGGLGSHFARAARNEAASVHAFAILATELRAHGAPAELARRCEAAADDEVRHAEQTSRLARRFGHEPLRAVIATVPPRSLPELALDNAVEGCVHETYAALIALYQVDCAADPAIAAELSLIAQDETRHAGLAWDLDDWLRSRLTSELQAAVACAQRAAVARLVDAHHLVEDERERRLAGLPTPAHCRHMIDSVTAHVWSA